VTKQSDVVAASEAWRSHRIWQDRHGVFGASRRPLRYRGLSDGLPLADLFPKRRPYPNPSWLVRRGRGGWWPSSRVLEAFVLGDAEFSHDFGTGGAGRARVGDMSLRRRRLGGSRRGDFALSVAIHAEGDVGVPLQRFMAVDASGVFLSLTTANSSFPA